MTGEISNVIMNAKTMKDRASMMTFFFKYEVINLIFYLGYVHTHLEPVLSLVA